MINPVECSPRKIKRIATESAEQDENKDTEIYEFYRLLIYPSIIRLKHEKDKINCSLWLNRIDIEEADLKIHLIKILFVSLQNYRNFSLFLNPPPEDLSELNLFDEDNTMDMVKLIQGITNNFYANEEMLQEAEYKRSAAVATDMCSYSSIKTSKYMVQSFYVRSDFPIQTWYNPTDIVLPATFDHDEWELYLNRFEIRTKSKDNDDNKPENTCESILKAEQVSKEMDTACIFRWHPHSTLYNKDRPRRLAAFVDVDSDVQNQPSTQQQIDESAFNIVHKKSFPGYKILNPRIYSTVLMPDPTFVFNTTGVKIIYNQTVHGSSATKRGNRLQDEDEDEDEEDEDDDDDEQRVAKTCCPPRGKRENAVSKDVCCTADSTETKRGDNVPEPCCRRRRRRCCDAVVTSENVKRDRPASSACRERRIGADDGNADCRADQRNGRSCDTDDDAALQEERSCCCGDSRSVREPRNDENGSRRTECCGVCASRRNSQQQQQQQRTTNRRPSISRRAKSECCCNESRGDRCDGPKNKTNPCDFPQAAFASGSTCGGNNNNNTGGDCSSTSAACDHGSSDDDQHDACGYARTGVPPCPYGEKSRRRRRSRADATSDEDGLHGGDSPAEDCFSERIDAKTENVTTADFVHTSDGYCDGSTDESPPPPPPPRQSYGKPALRRSVDFNNDVEIVTADSSSSSCG